MNEIIAQALIDKWQLVSYLEVVQGRELQKIFENYFNVTEQYHGPLPIESIQLNKQDANELLIQIEASKGRKGIWGEDCLLLQPLLAEINKLTIFESFNLLSEYLEETTSKDKEYYDYLQKHMNQAQAYCLDRCWVILFYLGLNIPSGASFLIDHFSKQVISKRYIDVAVQIRSLGYSTPHLPIPKLKSENIEIDGQEYTISAEKVDMCKCGELVNPEYRRKIVQYYFYSPERTGAYIDWIEKHTKEDESLSKRIRGALDYQAEIIYRCEVCNRFIEIDELTGNKTYYVKE